MSSLIDRTILKKDVVKAIDKSLKEKNLTANFKDNKWKILNENFNSKIIDVKINQQKDDEIYFLTICYQIENDEKVEKTNFRLFNNEITKNLEFIRTCDLIEFKEKE